MTATFTELAERAFSFLDKDGFSITNSSYGELTYRKVKIFVTISWSSQSGELEAFIGAGGSAADQSNVFSITDILRMEGVVSKKTSVPFQVFDEAKLAPFLQKLAEYVNSYAKPALAGDKMFFRRLASYRNREATAIMAEMHIRQVRNRAEVAWRKKDYMKVVELYSSVESDLLTKAEIERLKYAKNKG